MDKKQASLYTSLSSDTLDYYSKKVGGLKRRKLPGKVLYKKSELDQWLDTYLELKTEFDPEHLADIALAKLKKKMEQEEAIE